MGAVRGRSTKSLDLTAMTVTAEEAEVISFFEVVPSQEDPEIPWPYNTFEFRTVRNGIDLFFSIAPSYHDITLRLKRGENTIYEVSAIDIDDVRYFNDNGNESLELKLSKTDSLWLKLKPEISIFHAVGRP
jgi:hypothetical protein